MEWNICYQLNISEIDNHHKRLMSLLNMSYDAYKEGADDNTLATIIKELTEYISYHFETEEYWMTKHSYPLLAEHKAQHDIFSNKVITFQNDFLAGKATLSMELFRFLANWLRTHILETDALYGRFIAEQELTVW